jgi:hypothetical protein
MAGIKTNKIGYISFAYSQLSIIDMVGSGHFNCLCHIRFKVSATVPGKTIRNGNQPRKWN